MDYDEYAAGTQTKGGCRSAADVAAEEAALAARLAASTAVDGSALPLTEDETDKVFALALAAEGAAAGWLQVDLGEAAAGEVLYFGTAATAAAPNVCYRAKVRVAKARAKPTTQCLNSAAAASGAENEGNAANKGSTADGSEGGGGGGGVSSQQAKLLKAVFTPSPSSSTSTEPELPRSTVDIVGLAAAGELFAAATVAGTGPPHDASDGDRDCTHVDKGYSAEERKGQPAADTVQQQQPVDVAGTSVR